MVVVCIALCMVIGILLISFVCFCMAFFVPKRKPSKEEFPIPPGRVYEPYRDTMVKWMKEVRALPYEAVSITSFDGLTLCGKYYEYAPGAPIELMFHGYRGAAERDLCGGVQRSFALGRSALIVDQRASGQSEGHVITFGVYESRDCVSWIDFMIRRFGDDVKIILTGISMGAATVMMAAAKPLPPNVKGVLADCGYTSARAIIKKVIRDKKLPANVLYPFVRLGGWLYGGFDVEETPPIEAMKTCRLPIIFYHGDNDAYVPCDMSRENYAACLSEKQLVIVPRAGHGLSYMLDGEGYIQALREFTFEL